MLMLKFFNIIKNRVISVVFLKYDRKFYTVKETVLKSIKEKILLSIVIAISIMKFHMFQMPIKVQGTLRDGMNRVIVCGQVNAQIV